MLQWFKQLKQEWVLPEIHPERCVHSQCEIASCTNCVEACPHAAWLLDAGSLAIDTSRCDGCGLCVAACTETALTQELDLLSGELAGKQTLLVACEYTDQKLKGKGLIPCLYLISPARLTEAYKLGYQQLKFACGDCQHCPRQQTSSFTKHLEEFNRLLASRAAPLIQFQHLDPQTWNQQRTSLKPSSSPETAQTRRQFLKQAVNLAVEKGLEAKELSLEPELKPAQAWAASLPINPNSESALYPFAAQINPLRCNACDACIQLCPHQALSIVKLSAKEMAYETSPEQCTGCKLCVDSCDQQALTLKTYSPQPEPVLLKQTRCQTCGSPFHYPAMQTAQTQCRICSKANHHRQLFQVYS
ncbi:4Fe-4S binding protein [uncultured Thiothrix sp.]|uniref:4Fe-4S binding protein n=1 Tax=uncultured Thiothrix sp. TaxID=223185 RepID=UPI00262A2DC8|nr:4Fe-4S binding protein [uncultured Thiothrix sp.]